MKGSVCLTLLVIITLLSLITFTDICEARGGRGRGGGSFGGIFGGWRKYKKPTSNSNSRRTINGSPMHTTGTKSMSSGSSHSSTNSMKQTKQQQQQSSYPKQQAPLGSGNTAYGGYYGSGGAGASQMPPGSAYYANTAAMPPGAIYYAQPPMYSNGGTGNFLMGMLAGHMTSSLLFPHHRVTHVYHQSPDQNTQNGPRVIVVNNGEVTALNSTASTEHSTAAGYWPTDTVTPLEPFNESITPADALQPGKNPIFQRNKFNNTPNASMNQAAQQPIGANPTSASVPPTNGIICMPVLLNETNPNDPSKMQQVERVICFPAPPPPPSTSSPNCVIRTFVETDPNDPSKTIEVPKEICKTSTTSSEPRQVAGEIGESVTEKVEVKDEQDNNAEDSTIGETAPDEITERSTSTAA